MKTEKQLSMLLSDPQYYGEIDLGTSASISMLCGLADWLKNEFDAVSVSVAISKEDNVCGIEVIVPDIILEHGVHDRFFDDIQCADFLSFSKSADGNLAIRFGVQRFYANEQ